MARGYTASSDEPDPQKVVWLIGVFVDPRWRSRGLGRALSAEIVAWARERGASEVLLHVADWNASARHTYQSIGFVPTGARTTLAHDATVPEAEMSLRL
jgi:GNAT superfamily N-acetyltransferase